MLPFKSHTIFLQTPLEDGDIPTFRSTVNGYIQAHKQLFEGKGINTNIFHNHIDDEDNDAQGNGLISRYPLIQYRTVKGKATLVGFQEGASALQFFETLLPLNVSMNRQSVVFNKLMPGKTIDELVPIDSISKEYNLLFWAGFNHYNYARWKQAESFVQRIGLMEQILADHIRHFYRNTLIELKKPPLVTITDILNKDNSRVYNIDKAIIYNLHFRCNIYLPDGIGLGLGTARGYGRTFHKHRL